MFRATPIIVFGAIYIVRLYTLWIIANNNNSKPFFTLPLFLFRLNFYLTAAVSESVHIHKCSKLGWPPSKWYTVWTWTCKQFGKIGDAFDLTWTSIWSSYLLQLLILNLYNQTIYSSSSYLLAAVQPQQFKFRDHLLSFFTYSHYQFTFGCVREYIHMPL